MHACSDYTIKLSGENSDIETATKILADVFFDNDMIGEEEIVIEETYEVVWVEAVSQLAERMVKAAPDLESLVISGTVDTSESAGEYMDFLIKYENRVLTVQSSCWYLILDAEEFNDYEEFCEAYSGYSEEEFEELCECPHYILDSGDGDVVTAVPLDEPQIIDLDATIVYISEESAKSSPVSVCRCECGESVYLIAPQEEAFILYTGGSLTADCKKCGKKYKVYMH